jgi:hypothetical protein
LPDTTQAPPGPPAIAAAPDSEEVGPTQVRASPAQAQVQRAQQPGPPLFSAPPPAQRATVAPDARRSRPSGPSLFETLFGRVR